MTISTINNYSALSQADWFDRFGFSVRQTANMPEVEPISAINRSIIDVNDINYDNVKEYKNKVFSNDDKNTESKIENKDTNKKEDIKPNGEALTEEEKETVKKLEAIDNEVRLHEQAHLSAAGGLAVSGASYTYQQGPNGKKYAVGGEVSIDTSKENTPEKTISKMERVIAAAMAPAKPSGQDYSVASSARKTINNMKSEIAQNNYNEQKENNPTNSTNNNVSNKNIKPKDATSNSFNNSINNKLDTYIKSNSNFYSSNEKGFYANFVA
ncbi:MAG: hypothetical protein FWG85_06400 [Bacteroidetes bacterium]|nr:hypothetical protein [Bacteroidota bacterium]